VKAGGWQREHNHHRARLLESRQRATVDTAKALCVPFVVGTDPVPRWLLEKKRMQRMLRGTPARRFA
jgi:hypothetical protein